VVFGPELWRFFDVDCGILKFAAYSVCTLSARYFLGPAKGRIPAAGIQLEGQLLIPFVNRNQY
jgi:hypothetical protein